MLFLAGLKLLDNTVRALYILLTKVPAVYMCVATFVFFVFYVIEKNPVKQAILFFPLLTMITLIIYLNNWLPLILVPLSNFLSADQPFF